MDGGGKGGGEQKSEKGGGGEQMTFDSEDHLGHLIVPKMGAMPDPGTKRKRERKINIVQLNTKQGSVELRGICYLLNSLLYLLLPKAHNSLQSLMHELALSSPVLSSGNLTFAVRTGLKRLREKTREVRSVLTY